MTTSDQQRRSDVIDELRRFAAADAERGREFARSRSMHSSDAAAVVEILTAEARGEVLTPGRLAERIGLSAAATSALLNRLEAGGHVTRTHDHPDRRVVGLRSTAQIHADADAFFAPVAAALESALADYTAEQLDLFAEVLAELNAVAGPRPPKRGRSAEAPAVGAPREDTGPPPAHRP